VRRVEWNRDRPVFFVRPEGGRAVRGHSFSLRIATKAFRALGHNPAGSGCHCC
jgi:hypothetical protein